MMEQNLCNASTRNCSVKISFYCRGVKNNRTLLIYPNKKERIDRHALNLALLGAVVKSILVRTFCVFEHSKLPLFT
jgi:methyl coenzyme M reductase subunit C